MPIFMQYPGVSLSVREAALGNGNGAVSIGPKHDDPKPPPPQQGGAFGGLVILSHNLYR